ncbi:MAG TPA: hypothetical protein VF463_08130 [Sphingobium sp.]
MNEQKLFSPYNLGDILLANRIVMAPLTRNRAGAGLCSVQMPGTATSSNIMTPS